MNTFRFPYYHISWNKSIEDGGSPISGYQVLLNASPNPSTSDDWSIAVDWVPSAESLLMSSSTAGYAPKAEDIDDYYEILFDVDSVVPPSPTITVPNIQG